MTVLAVDGEGVFLAVRSPQPDLDTPERLPDDLDVRTACVEAHNLFGYRVGIPLAGDIAGVRWCD